MKRIYSRCPVRKGCKEEHEGVISMYRRDRRQKAKIESRA
jgi:hypothetical protein